MLNRQSVIAQDLPSSRANFRSTFGRGLLTLIGLGISLMAIAPAAFAHHPLGGGAPSNFIEGFLSGIGHPLIGLDHFAVVIAIGLLAAVSRQRLLVPLGFALAGLLGTGLHLQSLDLPVPELIIAASVFLFGILLAVKARVNGLVVAGLATLAGVFHGYAYGEAIVGAEMTPLLAYLIGFTCIQLVISLIAYRIGKQTLARNQQMPDIPIRFAGFLICGVGTAFLSASLMG